MNIDNKNVTSKELYFCVPLIENDLMNLHLINAIDLCADNNSEEWHRIELFRMFEHFYALGILRVYFLTAITW